MVPYYSAINEIEKKRTYIRLRYRGWGWTFNNFVYICFSIMANMADIFSCIGHANCFWDYF